MKVHKMRPKNPESKGKGGGRLSRSETVTVRLDPKLRYLTDLASRLHRRTSSSYIEWSIKSSLDSELLLPNGAAGVATSTATIGSEAEYLWDVDEADRFAKLALRYPYLLSHEEQILWKLVRENGYFWIGWRDKRTGEWVWTIEIRGLNFERLRQHWATLNAVAQRNAGASGLPLWIPSSEMDSGFPDQLFF
jgi:hypothetical protein